ncbi:peptidyl-prolyl cis-trans isomerase D [Methyloglobulus morosus KoM1]|uniref:Periplasmic chaperone PpiD n=1 Tax=Methyloglobulus morosus KoM1 TaxID=1116472 RepID=V5C3J1_9GAMM|nr:SurA N-terminal domain-containing protein [Methyloglobulus morosus]ESS71388.1 peptidyl-prolyl cis-trans isomerase D [Methyloglobulus morosus KoM1]
MLTTIREKAQGAFAWIILIVICVPFALWGIQNYIDTGKEAPVASVGDKDFYQRDVNNAYEQYAQNFRGMNIDEQLLKQQALDKLIKDEVLLQYTKGAGLVTTDTSARDFIKTLPYFQTDGKFDEKRYKSLLATQKLSTVEFVNKIKSALIMEQFQRSVIDSSFATPYAIENFFKIQNQQRDVDYITVALEKATAQPSDTEIVAYYQQHQDAYKLPEQVAVDYVELSLEELAKKVEVTDDKLKAYYEEQKDQFSTSERRKISHILFAVNAKTDDKTALAKAVKAQEDLKSKEFSAVAAEVSDDKLTAKKGGDLGLFIVGSMEKSFEEAASALKAGEVSKPVKSSFGYHLIKVTELVPAEVKSFDTVKGELTKTYQKAQAENAFYEAGEKLTEMSYENPDNLQTVSGNLGLAVKKSGFFTKDKGEGIATEQKIRDAAFTEEVLQGNNSTPIELGSDRLVVLRILEHKPAAVRELKDVKTDVIVALSNERAKQQAVDTANKIKQRLQTGEAIQKVAADFKLPVKEATGLTRNKSALPEQLSDAIFRAAKPVAGKATIFDVVLPTGEQVVVSLKKVTAGVMSEDDKKQMDLAKKNLAKAFGQSEFNAMLASLQTKADVSIKTQPKVQ